MTDTNDPAPVPTAALQHPHSRKAFRTVRTLLGGYLALSALALGVIVWLRNDTAVVNPAVWIRGTIVAASALATFAFAARAARGSRGAYRRLRVITGVMVAAIITIITLPGAFPLWMKAEQAVCGLLLLGVAVVVNGRYLRSLYATRLPAPRQPVSVMSRRAWWRIRSQPLEVLTE